MPEESYLNDNFSRKRNFNHYINKCPNQRDNRLSSESIPDKSVNDYRFCAQWKIPSHSRESTKIKKSTLRANKTYTNNRSWDLFLSRIDPDLDEHSVSQYIDENFNENIVYRIVKIKTRYNTYSSFRVLIFNVDSDINFLESKFWPDGILVK